MEFAKSILLKYGWREGDGLGKNTDGITSPIKAHLKLDNTGLGANKAEELANNWWERVYNDASSNIEVQSSGNNAKEQVILRQLDVDGVEISTKGYSVKKLKQKANSGNVAGSTRYGNMFLKASTLCGETGREEDVADHIRTEDIEFAPVKTLTDEQLFAACGGRTAHKGARHGLKSNGKLARINEQNNTILQKLKTESFEDAMKSNEWQVQHSHTHRKKTKKQKRNAQRWLERTSETAEDEVLMDMVHHADYIVIKNRKKKKAQEQTDQELARNIASMFTILSEEDGLEGDAEPSPEEESKSKSKRKLNDSSKKKPSLDEELDQLSEKIRKLDHNSVTIKKKKMKEEKKNKKMLREAAVKGSDVDNGVNIAILDPRAKYRKDYRRDLKENNRLLKAVVPHEVLEEKLPLKPVRLLRSDSSDASDEEEEDVVQKVNAEQERYWRKMRANVPKIKIIQPTEDDSLPLAQSLKQRHKNEVKRVGNRTSHGKRKKTKKKHRLVAQLADSLSKNL